MTGTGGGPGAATRAYLAAIRDRGPLLADWSTAPTRHKRYPAAPRLALPWPPARGNAETGAVGELLRQLLGLARVIWFHPAEDGGKPEEPPLLLMGRPAPSGGALYPIEAYLATGGIGLPAGLYHYDPVHHGLERMRAGDHREPLRDALSAARLPHLVLVLTAVFWRSMVKYGDFGYRLICEETGVLLAQALAVGDRLGLTVEPRLLFDDGRVEQLLGLDAAREGALAGLTLTIPGAEPPPPGAPGVGALAAESAPRPRPMPHRDAAATLHRATRTPQPTRGRAVVDRAVPPPGGEAAKTRLPPVRPVRLADGVAGRASPASGYRAEPISLPALASVLAAAAAPYPADLPGTSDGLVTIAWYLLALRVDGLPTGGYRYDRCGGELLRVTGGAAVEQVRAAPRLLSNTRRALPGAAAALIPVGCPLAGVAAYGDRWYRLQQIETGLALQRATLAAVAIGLAARIHSDGANEVTDAVLALGRLARGRSEPLGRAGWSGPGRWAGGGGSGGDGLGGTGSWQSLSFLLLGTARAGGRLLARRLDRTHIGGRWFPNPVM